MINFLLVLSISVGTIAALPPHGRIFGGTAASPGQFPFIVALNNDQQYCDGSIINKNWILTAAHCIDSGLNTTEILAGTNIENSNSGTIYKAKFGIRHEEYNANASQNDIGLIQIDGEFEFSEKIQPIEFGDAETNATCFAVGWGSTENTSYPEELLYVELAALRFEDCQNIIESQNTFYFGSEQVCGLGGEGKGVCFGDSGGPLVCDGKLAGVVSYGVSVCARGLPDVYTRPLAYIDWINEKIA